MKTAIELIADERQRQINVEGWKPAHDALHTDESIACAAACYATPHSERDELGWCGQQTFTKSPGLWKWHPTGWKPTPDNRIKELVKAGALIVAEIERLQNSTNDEESVAEIEARAEKNLELISKFCEHLKDDFEIEITEEQIITFFEP